MMEYIIVNDRLSEILNSNDVVVLNFTATWAVPARKQISVLQELNMLHNKVEFVLADVDQASELATIYKIRSVPTLLFFKDKKIVWTKIGLLSKEVIEDFLKKIHLLAFI